MRVNAASRHISQAGAAGTEVLEPPHAALRIRLSDETWWRQPVKNPSDFVARYSHRYHLTPKGRTVITALLTAHQADTAELTELAA